MVDDTIQLTTELLRKCLNQVKKNQTSHQATVSFISGDRQPQVLTCTRQYTNKWERWWFSPQHRTTYDTSRGVCTVLSQIMLSLCGRSQPSGSHRGSRHRMEQTALPAKQGKLPEGTFIYNPLAKLGWVGGFSCSTTHASHSSDTDSICQHLHSALLPTTAILLWEDPAKGLSLGMCPVIQSRAEEAWQGMTVLIVKPSPKRRGQENWETFPRAKFGKSQGASRNHESQFDFKVRQTDLAEGTPE